MTAEALPQLRAEAEIRVVESDPEVLDEQVLYQQGVYRRVRQYLRGWHPELGVLHMGWQGQETIVEKDMIRASVKFMVQSADGHRVNFTGLTNRRGLFIVKSTT